MTITTQTVRKQGQIRPHTLYNETFRHEIDSDGPNDWMALADCQFTDPEVFFPEQGEHPRWARAVCAQCEVRDKCLEYALSMPKDLDRYGIFGGTTARERGIIRDLTKA